VTFRTRPSAEDALAPQNVEPLLRGRFGRPYLHRETCASTQELVRGLPEGAVATCELQTTGRGRHGRRWECPSGTGLLFSLSLWPATPTPRLPPLALVLAEALCETLDPGARVRWPNDVMVDGRKLAGLLAEGRAGQLVVGVGVNVNADASELVSGARVPPTSLRLLRGAPVERAALLADVLAHIEIRYDEFERHGFTGLTRDDLRGRTVVLAGGASGRCDGVDAQGRLVVAGRAFTSDEVTRVDVPSADEGQA
jgi:BirA family transcriptional regulator, biotin operon repressor / biotin---[acetyl-CoA-carboxylase] ligase